MFDIILIIEKFISSCCYWKSCFHSHLCGSYRAYFMFILNYFQRKRWAIWFVSGFDIWVFKKTRNHEQNNLLYCYLQNPSCFLQNFLLLFPVIMCSLLKKICLKLLNLITETFCKYALSIKKLSNYILIFLYWLFFCFYIT